MERHLTEAGRFAWPLLQGTAAATLAWVIARYGLDHQQPFFAPVAAVIALNASLGERGVNAVRLLQGVVTGIVAGELVLNLIGSGWAALGLATFAATAVARATGGARIVIAQAAVGAILIVAIGDAEAGPARLIDALVGASVALIFSQLLFTPEPVTLIRRAEAAALKEMAKGLALTEKAMRDDEDDAGERALERLRSLRDQLSELARTRAAGHRIVRRAAGWRSQRSPLVREAENAGHLDLLGGSCLVLARISLSADPEARHTMAPQIHELAGALSDLAENPGDLETRQGVADRALAVGRQCSAQTAEAQPGLAAVVTMVDLAATDIMVFAGVDPEQAAAAVEGDTGTFAVASPPATARVPFRRDS